MGPVWPGTSKRPNQLLGTQMPYYPITVALVLHHVADQEHHVLQCDVGCRYVGRDASHHVHQFRPESLQHPSGLMVVPQFRSSDDGTGGLLRPKGCFVTCSHPGFPLPPL